MKYSGTSIEATRTNNLEMIMTRKPVLVTLTAPTSAGKSHLLNYIRDVAALPCLVSTTTRSPRAGEREGVDYFFISEERSREIEEADGFAELVEYGGVRYGVTREELQTKLSTGLTFLIVEPSGIESYVAPALEMGALHLKYFIHTELGTRIERFKGRILADIQRDFLKDLCVDATISTVSQTVSKHIDRLVSMLTVERSWGDMQAWDRILFGAHDPKENLAMILKDVEKTIAMEEDRLEWLANSSWFKKYPELGGTAL